MPTSDARTTFMSTHTLTGWPSAHKVQLNRQDSLTTAPIGLRKAADLRKNGQRERYKCLPTCVQPHVLGEVKAVTYQLSFLTRGQGGDPGLSSDGHGGGVSGWSAGEEERVPAAAPSQCQSHDGKLSTTCPSRHNSWPRS